MKNVSAFLLMMVLAGPIPNLYAITPGEKPAIAGERTMARKLQRGFLNVVLSPMEMVHGFEEENQRFSEIFPTWVWGLTKGSLLTARRAAAGVFEVATFFIPAPPDYGHILEPEFPWESLEDPENVT